LHKVEIHVQQYSHGSRVLLKQEKGEMRAASRGKSKPTCNNTIMEIECILKQDFPCEAKI